MGRLIFGIDIQGEIANAVKPTDALPFVLRKYTLPAEDTNLLSGPGTVATPVDYLCHGFELDFTAKDMERSPGVERGDKKILLIAKPLADAGVRPETEDLIIDASGNEYTVITANTDTAIAKWVCQCRGR
jgi:hypothetical protein